MGSAALHPPGRIGPNAITRVAEAMHARSGQAATAALFEAAGLLHHLHRPPQDMVDEAEVRHLHGQLRARLGETAAREVAQAAGRLTAQYLLARRIPRPVQALLKLLPAPWAARVLLTAIRRNAWTFVGSGQFSATFEPRSEPPVRLHIRNNPLCQGLQSDAPACDFYAATYQHLFQVLVHPHSRVVEVACEACGDAECRFELGWRPR